LNVSTYRFPESVLPEAAPAGTVNVTLIVPDAPGARNSGEDWVEDKPPLMSHGLPVAEETFGSNAGVVTVAVEV
jgi:hypothetical protein